MTEYLTPAGRKKILEELEFLQKVKIPQIVERIRLAIEMGDLSENAEFETAKEDQALAEMRVKNLKKILQNSKVIDHDQKKGDVISLGSKVTLEINSQKKEYSIVGSNEANPSQGCLSCESPLGRLLIGQKAGQKVDFKTPTGVIMKVKVIKAE
ncbi:transcription elongation factor GreA [Patescibacteria group bacterium]|nr:transcription elongation factor GreA [Patescibacteria group bacterium]